MNNFEKITESPEELADWVMITVATNFIFFSEKIGNNINYDELLKFIEYQKNFILEWFNQESEKANE